MLPEAEEVVKKRLENISGYRWMLKCKSRNEFNIMDYIIVIMLIINSYVINHEMHIVN